MVTRVQKWGNSQGLRLSKELLATVRVGVGDEVEVTVREGTIVVRPIRRVRGALELEELVAAIPEGFERTSAGWGPAAGGEVW
jgi:antitoxin MazE